MKCPYCSSFENRVIDSRVNQTGDITRRRRECLKCEGRYTTYERVEEVMPAVIKKDGRREPFSREKVFAGIQKACQKTQVTIQKMESLVRDVEKHIQSYGLKEIPARAVGQMIMKTLHKINKVAYVRFASFYRDFVDVEEFVADLTDFPEETLDQTSNMEFPFVSRSSDEAKP